MEANRKHRLGQRAILAAFEAEPGNAFLLSELCRLVYPGLDRIEKKAPQRCRSRRQVRPVDRVHEL
jgi:hypothetical protein